MISYRAFARSTRKRLGQMGGVDLQSRLLRVVSLGTIISGALACLASVGVGMGLVLAGVTVLAEL